MFISGKNWLKYREKKYYFHNYIFRKFEIVVCFAPLLHGVERNTFLNFDLINDSLKSKTWNSWKRIHCNEEARRIRGNGTSRSRMQEWQMVTYPVFSPHSLHTNRQAESARHCVGFRSGITGCRSSIIISGAKAFKVRSRLNTLIRKKITGSDWFGCICWSTERSSEPYRLCFPAPFLLLGTFWSVYFIVL